jgi:hypothetical protein
MTKEVAAITPGMTPVVPDVKADGEWLLKEADWLEDDDEVGEYDDEEDRPITDYLQVFQDVSPLSG